jgi:crotonobetainyl-CoA:carnitine CoA-transferase CaiB-like acyl-CoA transferase
VAKTSPGADTLLEGIRVVDLSRVLAGPFAAQALAELGADVIKVEPPGGDVARGVGPHRDGRSLYFAALNSGKRGMVLDLKDPSGRTILDTLLATADVVVENFLPGTGRRLRCAPDQLLDRHPSLVVVSVSGWARGSDHEEEGAFDVVAQAEAGIMAITGEPGRPPVRAGVAAADLAAGLWAATAAAAALVARDRDGRGRHVEVPLIDAAASLLSYVGVSALATDADPGPVGSGHHTIVPYGAYPAADGWVVVAVIGDRFWPALCRVLGLHDLGNRPELADNVGRVAARSEIDSAVAERLAGLTVADAVAALGAAGVPVAPVRSVLSALGSPYATARGLVGPVADGSYRTIRAPMTAGGRPLRPAPDLGEHTAQILDELGLRAGD